jgi:hypothetical protein
LKNRIALFISLLLSTLANAFHGPHSDSVLHYKNGKDSVRIIYIGDKMHKLLTYYPYGKTESITTIVKDKEYSKGRVKQETISTYISWTEKGKISTKQRDKLKRWNYSGKRITWTFRKNGKRCLKRFVGQPGWKY